MSFRLNDRAIEVRWSKGSCGQSGCADQECVCALCAKPIGVAEEILEQNNHDPECFGCEMCYDQVPIMLFRGEGKDMLQAAFHDRCFKSLCVVE